MSSQKQFDHLQPEEYDRSAALAMAVSQEMLARLDWVTLDPKIIVDVGCGTGQSTKLLQERYPAAKILALDLAYPMLCYAKQQGENTKTTLQNVAWVSADTAALPFADHSVDLVFANLILPWCKDTEKTFREWRRILRPEGLLVFTSLGPDTLKEWREFLGDITLPNLIDMHDHGDALTKVRFADPVLDVDYFTVTYRELASLFSELQATGMLLSGDHASLFSAMRESHSSALWEVTYEVVFGHAFGPPHVVDQVADEFGTIRIPLSHLRRRR